jgi:hypothetical protein
MRDQDQSPGTGKRAPAAPGAARARDRHVTAPPAGPAPAVPPDRALAGRSPQALLALQRAAGNSAVARLADRRTDVQRSPGPGAGSPAELYDSDDEGGLLFPTHPVAHSTQDELYDSDDDLPIAPRVLTEAEVAVRTQIENDYLAKHTPELAGWAATPELARPYITMVDTGELWNRARRRDPTSTRGGRVHIAEQSWKNLHGMAYEIDQRGGDWREPMADRMTAALNTLVLRHYTNAGRLERMGRSTHPAIDAKQKLLQEDPSLAGETNTPAHDEHYLANTGFVFFFLENRNAPFRTTRFTDGDRPARVTVPMSRLTANGWIMLTDFLDQDFPTIRADEHGETLKYSRFDRVAPEDRMTSFKNKADELWRKDPLLKSALNSTSRALARALAADPATPPTRQIVRLLEEREEADQIFKGMFNTGYTTARREFDRQAATAARFSRQVRRFSPAGTIGTPDFGLGGESRYMHGSGTAGAGSVGSDAFVQRYREHLHGNILAGPDIVPGLALRGVLEVARIEAAGGNEPLVDRLKNMSGPDLVEVLLRDFVRPQAMLPWSVAFDPRNDAELRPE